MYRDILPRLLLPVLIAVVIGAAGCGQKGDLYLPDRPAHKESGKARR